MAGASEVLFEIWYQDNITRRGIRDKRGLMPNEIAARVFVFFLFLVGTRKERVGLGGVASTG